jgi:hypothetical protein
MRDPKSLGQALLDIVSRHMPAEVSRFVTQGAPQAGKSLQRGLFFGYFAGVGRRTRDLAFAPTAAERGQLEELGILAPEAFTIGTLSRVALLALGCAALEPHDHLSLLKDAYAKGDNGERVAVLRALSLLPDPRRFLDIAAEACRTHVQDVFEAIACDNPYPEQYFPDASFNQLVIKALFTEVPLARMRGLKARKNPELYRMARDYESERRAAARPVSPDLDYVAHALENEP